MKKIIFLLSLSLGFGAEPPKSEPPLTKEIKDESSTKRKNPSKIDPLSPEEPSKKKQKIDLVAVEADSAPKKEPPKKKEPPRRQEKVDLVVDENESLIFESVDNIEEVFVVNPKLADIRMIDKKKFYIFGFIPGDTRIYVSSGGKAQSHELNVAVRFPVNKLKKMIDEIVPDNLVEVKSIKKGILLEGSVETSSEADTIQKIAAQFVDTKDQTELINNVKIITSMQVSLQIKVASVSRKTINELNLDWSGNIATGIAGKKVNFKLASAGVGGKLSLTNNWFPLKDITTALDFLEQQSLATILAEPVLTTLSGVSATFDVGGTRPILKNTVTPGVGGAAATTTSEVEFKPFGMKLTFTPTIIGDNILLDMKVTLNDIDEALKVVDGNKNDVFGETTKSTNTSVILGDGQSLMIAGVIEKRKTESQNNNNSFLSNIPFLNAIFNTVKDKDEEKEVVIVVKPQLVTPMQANRKVKMPTDLINFTPIVDMFLYGGLTRKNTSPLPKTFRAGFFLGS